MDLAQRGRHALEAMMKLVRQRWTDAEKLKRYIDDRS
jgi:hypothetical protein